MKTRKYTTERLATLALFKAYKPTKCLWIGAFDGAVLRNTALRHKATQFLAFDSWGDIESVRSVTHYDILTPHDCDEICRKCETNTEKLANVSVRRFRQHYAIEIGLKEECDFWYLNCELSILYDDISRITEARPGAIVGGTGLFDKRTWSYGTIVARDVRCFLGRYDLRLFGSGIWSLVPQTIGA